MRCVVATALSLGVLLTGCGSGPLHRDEGYAGDGAPETEFGFMEAMEQPGLFDLGGNYAPEVAYAVAVEPEDSSGIKPRVPPPAGAQIAYSFEYGFRVEADDLATLQQRHVGVCDAMGAARCRVLSVSRAGSAEDGYGRLMIEVASRDARQFGNTLADAAEGLDAEQVSFGMDGEDLTETIVDTEAHLRSRRLLRDRLMEILRSRQGSVKDLVEAERSVAEVNEELDRTASRLADLRNRVSFSAVSIEYAPELLAGSGGFARPIGAALGAAGSTLGTTIAVLIYVAIALVPVTAFLLLLRWLWRKSGLRIRREKAKAAAAT